jgi:hypothetical protein
MTKFCIAFYESYLSTSAAYSSGSSRRSHPNSRRATAFFQDVNPTVSHRKHINENNLQQAVQEVKEHRMSLEEAA